MSTIKVSSLQDISEITSYEWDSCACPEICDGKRPMDPFTSHKFLNALEQSGSVGRMSGWIPNHIVARENDRAIAVMPLYLKAHSQGEYIFDHNWSNAYNRAVGTYYPKLQGAVPFTPVTGRRLLIKPGTKVDGRYVLLEAAKTFARENNISSIHLTFCSDDEAIDSTRLNLLRRLSLQYHWKNEGYSSFDNFLERLAHRKRKAIKKERKTALKFGGKILKLTGDHVQREHWDSFWMFYQDTGSRKWGTPYLTRSFFDHLHELFRDDLLLIMAERDGRVIAGALNFLGRQALFGRYWGCLETHSCLHYELCYYQAIEFAIENGLCTVEAGAQGDHKLARGYLPAITNSLHWFLDKTFSLAVEDYLEKESRLIRDQYKKIIDQGPFKRD